jgi:tetratricopeptide (TPR) repeat protein
MKRFLEGLFAGVFGLLAVTPGLAALPEPVQGADSTTAEAYFQFARARALELDGQWEEALEAYDQALALDPLDSSIYSEIAFAYYSRNDASSAIDYAERAILMNPDNLDAHRLLSEVLTRQLARSEAGISRELLDRAILEWEHVVRLAPGERAAYLTLGRLYRVIGDPERAMAVYRDFLRVEPASEEGAVSLAELQVEAGNPEEAVSILRDFVASRPDSGAALALLGDIYYQMGDYPNAADALESALELAPDNRELLARLAEALFLADRLDQAAARYETLLERDPDDPVIRLRLGQIYRQRMDYEAAREHIERADRLVPNSPDILFERALLDRDEGRFEQALEGLEGLLGGSERPFYTPVERQTRQRLLTHVAIIQTIVDDYPAAVETFGRMKAVMRTDDDGTIDAYIVDTLRMAETPREALDHAVEAREAFPQNRQLRIAEADLRAELVDLDAGVAALRGMLSGTDADGEIYATLVGVYERRGDYAAAQSVLDEMIANLENDGSALFLQGALHERQENIDAAEQAFRRALAVQGDNPATLNYLGYMMADQDRNLEEALAMIQTAVRSDPINGAYLDSLGWVYYRLDEMELAEQFLTRAVLFSNSDPTLHEHLGDLYRTTGRVDLARQAYLRSLERAGDQAERDRVRQKLDELPPGA